MVECASVRPRASGTGSRLLASLAAAVRIFSKQVCSTGLTRALPSSAGEARPAAGSSKARRPLRPRRCLRAAPPPSPPPPTAASSAMAAAVPASPPRCLSYPASRSLFPRRERCCSSRRLAERATYVSAAAECLLMAEDAIHPTRCQAACVIAYAEPARADGVARRIREGRVPSWPWPLVAAPAVRVTHATVSTLLYDPPRRPAQAMRSQPLWTVILNGPDPALGPRAGRRSLDLRICLARRPAGAAVVDSHCRSAVPAPV